VQNYVRLLVTGNNNWLVPAGLEERRFAVLDVSDAKRRTRVFPGDRGRDGPPAGAKPAAYLLDGPSTLIDPDMPLREQKISIPADRGRFRAIEQKHCRSGTTRHEGARRQPWWLDIRRMVPNVKRSRRRIAGPGGTQLHWYYRFPSLAECRQQIVRLVGETDFAADSPETWTPEQEDQK
jgi:hypothetical protein